MFRLKIKDTRILQNLSEYHLLTIPQITVLHFSSKHVARRRIHQFIKEGFIEGTDRGFGRRRGRPERIISLSKKGIEFLVEREILPSSYEVENYKDTKFIDHQLLINWFQLHLIHMEKAIPSLKVKFFTSSFLLNLWKRNESSISTKEFPNDGVQSGTIHFIPDGVFSIIDDSDNQRPRSLLFFLEVDMGTESLSSLKRNPKDIRQKILNYQDYFKAGKYKYWESIFNCKFNGFRLLFLTNTQSRMTMLCRLMQEIPPSDFIWVSSQSKMFEKGLSDAIWQRGGNLNIEPESILGSKIACFSPLPPIKD